MSDPIAEPQGTPVPAATPPAATPAPVTMTSDMLKARLDEEREKAQAKLLKDLGFEKADDVKAIIANARKAEDAKKTEAEKLQTRIGELEPAAKRAADLEAVIKERATAELATLTDAQRAAVASIGGEDPAAQLRAITALRPTWGAPAAAPAAPAAPPKAPANTAPAPSAPAPAAPGMPNHLATWESLKKTNPVEAARYLLTHRSAISEARAKASPNS